jgi:hypothetical protein
LFVISAADYRTLITDLRTDLEANIAGWFGCDPVRDMTASANHDSGQSELSQQDLRRIFREGLRQWADYEAEKPAGWRTEDWDAKIKPGLLDRATEVVWKLASETNANDDALATGRAALEPIIAHGLVRRENRFLRAPAIVRPEMLLDWGLWTALRAMYESYGGDVAEVRCEHWGEEFHLIVCEGCTAVFRPRRRVASTRHCPLCRARPPAPPLGSPETFAAYAARTPITVCVPERVGNVVTSWKVKTLIRCPECGEPVFARKGAVTCAKPACQSRHRRRVKARADEV